MLKSCINNIKEERLCNYKIFNPYRLEGQGPVHNSIRAKLDAAKDNIKYAAEKVVGVAMRAITLAAEPFHKVLLLSREGLNAFNDKVLLGRSSYHVNRQLLEIILMALGANVVAEKALPEGLFLMGAKALIGAWVLPRCVSRARPHFAFLALDPTLRTRPHFSRRR